METQEEGATPVHQHEHKSKHKSKDKDRDRKDKRDRKDRSSKSSRHDRDESREHGAATDRPVEIANGRAEAEPAADTNGLRPLPPAPAPTQHAPAEVPAAAQQPPDRRAAPVVNDSGGEISMSIEETNRCSSCA